MNPFPEYDENLAAALYEAYIIADPDQKGGYKDLAFARASKLESDPTAASDLIVRHMQYVRNVS